MTTQNSQYLFDLDAGTVQRDVIADRPNILEWDGTAKPIRGLLSDWEPGQRAVFAVDFVYGEDVVRTSKVVAVEAVIAEVAVEVAP